MPGSGSFSLTPEHGHPGGSPVETREPRHVRQDGGGAPCITTFPTAQYALGGVRHATVPSNATFIPAPYADHVNPQWTQVPRPGRAGRLCYRGQCLPCSS
jgi:hypothetical protein